MIRKGVIFLLMAVLAGAVWYRLKHLPSEAEEAEVKPTATVEVTPLKSADIAETLDVLGVIAAAPSGDRTTAAPFDGVVRQVHVAVGARVAPGDLIVELDPSPETKLQLDSARNALSAATLNLADAQGRYDLKLATRQDLLTAQQAEQEARAKLASFESRGLGGSGKLTAASAGVVSTLTAVPGTLVPAGTALVTISSGERMEGRLAVEPADAARVHVGQSVILVSANRVGAESVRSTVRLAGGTQDPVTGTIEIRVALPAGAPLMLGEHVKAAIELQKKTDALVVPRSGVLPDEDKQLLFTVKDGKAVRHEVRAGIASGDVVEVIGENLHAGDPVVTLGNYELTDGMAVQSAGEQKKAGSAPARQGKEAKP